MGQGDTGRSIEFKGQMLRLTNIFELFQCQKYVQVVIDLIFCAHVTYHGSSKIKKADFVT